MDTLPTFEGWNPSTSLPGSTRSNTRCSSMCWGSGSCTSMPWILGSPLRRSMTASSSASVACLGSRMVSWCRPASPQALPFMRTYTWEAGLSPTRTTASPGELPGDALQVRHALHVGLERLAPRAGAGSRHRVCGLDDHADRRAVRHVVVVRRDAVDDDGVLPVFRRHFDAELDVRAVVLVREHLPDVVQQAAAFGQLGVEPQLARHHPREPRHFLRVLQDVLSV